jgi:hypothetical protein
VDHHRLGGIVHIPEHPVALVVEGPVDVSPAPPKSLVPWSVQLPRAT